MSDPAPLTIDELTLIANCDNLPDETELSPPIRWATRSPLAEDEEWGPTKSLTLGLVRAMARELVELREECDE